MEILVLGAGSWGTALALILADNGNKVWLWSNEAEHVQEMLATGKNSHFLPNKFPASIQPIADFTEQAKQIKDIIIVVPSHGFRGTLAMLAPHISPTTRICWATKGLENDTGLLLHQVAEQVLGEDRPLAILSGPSFAIEVAKCLPTAVTIAATDEKFAKDLVDLFHNNYFRPYTSTDIIGVQLGGTVKNVMAIASGIVDGLEFGANSRAALITRGLNEMVRFGVALGGKAETFMGLAGMGDLVLTCTDKLSRNYRFGFALAKGSNIEQAQASIGQVVEGVPAAREVNRVAKERNIDMPIVEQVNNVLLGVCTPTEAVKILLSRQPKAEFINK